MSLQVKNGIATCLSPLLSECEQQGRTMACSMLPQHVKKVKF